MKIYTKKGDKGYTALLGGFKVSKHHLRIEAYGTVDELNSFTGLVRDGIADDELREELKNIQKLLFSIGARLASPKRDQENSMNLPEVGRDSLNRLEEVIDKIDKKLPELKSFILPGGHPEVSYCHVARSVCRRAERTCVALADAEEIDSEIISYLNRLSDFFFILARHAAHSKGVEEVKWVPGE